MFSTKQTKFILFLSVITTILISVVGLNWRKEEKVQVETRAVLELPDYIKEEAVREPVPAAETTAPAEKEEPAADDEDEGTIILF
ncbi:MAG: hypothetical protein U9R36_05630 [Elusimicrobiota bacterium]|nr:hypothetical protein [Elusimicrobiota bacterium]